MDLRCLFAPFDSPVFRLFSTDGLVLCGLLIAQTVAVTAS